MPRLTEQEMGELRASVESRIRTLAGRGVTFAGSELHYIILLLEQLLSPQGKAAAEETHYLWLREQLDEAEQKIREHLLTQGVAR